MITIAREAFFRRIDDITSTPGSKIRGGGVCQFLKSSPILGFFLLIFKNLIFISSYKKTTFKNLGESEKQRNTDTLLDPVSYL